MSENSKIEWTDATWNPIRGCSRVSEGCRNCYAETVAKRFSGPGLPYEGLIASGGQWNGKIKVVDHVMNQPLRWKRPRRIFVNSMSDLFHPGVSIKTIGEVFKVMAAAPQHTFQILTKRPETARNVLSCISIADKPWPLPNVWLGVSVEDQATADERIPLLLTTPAACRWISAEPLLGPVDLTNVGPSCGYAADALAGFAHDFGVPYRCLPSKVDWVVVGGESGQGARPMHPAWAGSIRDQCRKADIPFFFKQWGDWQPIQYVDSETGCGLLKLTPGPARKEVIVSAASKCGTTHINMRRVGKKHAGRLLDGREWNEYPKERVERTEGAEA